MAPGCGDDGGGGTPDAEPAETLTPEPPGAPSQTAEGRLTCLGNNAPAPPDTSVIELTGYVRTYADPIAAAAPPAAAIEAFTATGTSLGSGFADPAKDGRVALSVAIQDEGFTGYVMITQSGFADYRFVTNRPVTRPEANGWTWLLTTAELDAAATALGTTIDPARGQVIGSVHDCDNFGIQYAVVTVAGSSDEIAYVDTFTVGPTRTFTDPSGRFVQANVTPGQVVIKAYGRLAASGPLTLLGSVQTTVEAGKVTAVVLQPRVGSN
jgi:hypothetical protein